jgi:hypothetical protein
MFYQNVALDPRQVEKVHPAPVPYQHYSLVWIEKQNASSIWSGKGLG